MRHWVKMLAAAALALPLTSCFWGPGKFSSTLALNRNGTFILDYRGEILLQLPDEKAREAVPWEDSMARCADEQDDKSRPCTAAEIAKQKAEHEKGVAESSTRSRKEAEDLAKTLGMPGTDDESNKEFAAKLMKYQGWKSVIYKGKGLFEVDYHFVGTTAQDFVCPLMPDSDMLVPFITIRRRTDGTVLVAAPAFTGGSGPFGVRAKQMGLPDRGEGGPVSHASGRFTVVTDGEILTNNSEDGPQPHSMGRQVHWDVNPSSTKIPETLVKL